MKNLIMICLLGTSLIMSACAHKCGTCTEGSCKMEKKDGAHCGHHKEEAKGTDASKMETKK